MRTILHKVTEREPTKTTSLSSADAALNNLFSRTPTSTPTAGVEQFMRCPKGSICSLLRQQLPRHSQQVPNVAFPQLESACKASFFVCMLEKFFDDDMKSDTRQISSRLPSTPPVRSKDEAHELNLAHKGHPLELRSVNLTKRYPGGEHFFAEHCDELPAVTTKSDPQNKTPGKSSSS